MIKNWDNTIKELLTNITPKVMDRPTHVLIEKKRNKLANIIAYIKMLHTAFPEGGKFGYAAAN